MGSMYRMIKEADRIPITDVVGSYLKLVQSGRHLKAEHPDSLVVTPEKNLWYYFAAGVGGGPVKFVMEYEQLDRDEAALKLLLDYGRITEREYERMSGKKPEAGHVRKKLGGNGYTKQHTERRRREEKASPETTALVYGVLPEIYGLAQRHREHLERVRRVKDLSDYFTYPGRDSDAEKLILKAIAEKKAGDLFGRGSEALIPEERDVLIREIERIRDELPCVPGFYRDESGKLGFMRCGGIAFLVRDDAGTPRGVHIRRDTVRKGESRYIWFSSSYALMHEEWTGGASPGTPAGYLAASAEGSGMLCVTEGRFKAEAIAAKGNNCVYLSGVSTWKKEIPMIARLAEQSAVNGDRRVFLMFDADMKENAAVGRQLTELAEALREAGCCVYVITWPQEAGKGFDDLVFKKGCMYYRYMSVWEYVEDGSLKLLRKGAMDTSADKAPVAECGKEGMLKRRREYFKSGGDFH